jgi:hypothetical protein
MSFALSGAWWNSYIFKGGSAPNSPESADANGYGNVDVGDAVYLIHYIFNGGPPPER